MKNGYKVISPEEFHNIPSMVKATNPYNTSILTARISAVLKRAYPNSKSDDIVEYNGVRLNILTSKVEYNSMDVELTKNELKILYYILMN